MDEPSGRHQDRDFQSLNQIPSLKMVIGALKKLCLRNLEKLQCLFERRLVASPTPIVPTSGEFDQRDRHVPIGGWAPLQAMIEVGGGDPPRSSPADNGNIGDRLTIEATQVRTLSARRKSLGSSERGLEFVS